VKIEPPNRVVLIDPQEKSGRTFECDFAFDSSDPSSDHYADQEAVYKAIGVQIVENAVKGFNACLCAYGQTGTGKTHTVFGEWRDTVGRGILPRLTLGLFTVLDELRAAGAKTSVQVSYIEIYNNRLRDLLASAAPRPVSTGSSPPKSRPDSSPNRERTREDQRLKIHTHPAVGVYVENLSEIGVKSYEELGKLAAIGQKVRATEGTSMNDKSSRSHTIFSVKVEVSNSIPDGGSPDGGHRMATLQVVDLAGRENEQDSECTGDRFRELTFINRSLFQLANCVNALSNDDRQHVPFRNSKLTLLLSESFQRNSRTCLLATLNPSSTAYEENLLTCRFLESTGRITTQPIANRFSAQDLREKLQDELAQMRDSLGLAKESPNPNLELHETLLRHMCRGLNEAGDIAKRRADAKQAILADACEKAGRQLSSVQSGLQKLEKANAAVGASLTKAETQLSQVEAMVEQVRQGRVRERQRPNASVSVLVEPLPPILGASPRAEAKEKSGGPTVTFNFSLPEIIVL
jgi:hypothetical protein